jgi:hypothetical protein
MVIWAVIAPIAVLSAILHRKEFMDRASDLKVQIEELKRSIANTQMWLRLAHEEAEVETTRARQRLELHNGLAKVLTDKALADVRRQRELEAENVEATSRLRDAAARRPSPPVVPADPLVERAARMDAAMRELMMQMSSLGRHVQVGLFVVHETGRCCFEYRVDGMLSDPTVEVELDGRPHYRSDGYAGHFAVQLDRGRTYRAAIRVFSAGRLVDDRALMTFRICNPKEWARRATAHTSDRGAGRDLNDRMEELAALAKQADEQMKKVKSSNLSAEAKEQLLNDLETAVCAERQRIQNS